MRDMGQRAQVGGGGVGASAGFDQDVGTYLGWPSQARCGGERAGGAEADQGQRAEAGQQRVEGRCW